MGSGQVCLPASAKRKRGKCSSPWPRAYAKDVIGKHVCDLAGFSINIRAQGWECQAYTAVGSAQLAQGGTLPSDSNELPGTPGLLKSRTLPQPKLDCS